MDVVKYNWYEAICHNIYIHIHIYIRTFVVFIPQVSSRKNTWLMFLIFIHWIGLKERFQPENTIFDGKNLGFQ